MDLENEIGDVVVGGGLPGGPGGFAFEFDEPFGGGVRLGGREPGQVIGERRVPAAGPTQFGPGARVGLPVDRVVGWRSTVWPGVRPRAWAPGPHQRPGGSPAWAALR